MPLTRLGGEQASQGSMSHVVTDCHNLVDHCLVFHLYIILSSDALRTLIMVVRRLEASAPTAGKKKHKIIAFLVAGGAALSVIHTAQNSHRRPLLTSPFTGQNWVEELLAGWLSKWNMYFLYLNSQSRPR